MKRFRMIRWVVVFCIIGFSSVDAGAAESSARTIRVSGRKAITVTTPEIKLSDLAEISSTRPEDDDVIIGLQKVFIARSPNPGAITTISAAEVLERLQHEGISLSQIGYSLPRVMTVSRAARSISIDEITDAIQSHIKDSGRDMELKHIEYAKPISVAPGKLELSVSPNELGSGAERSFELSASVDQTPPVKFRVQAQVDEWRELPVASRPLGKGAVVGPDDMMRARLNLSAIPKDAALSEIGIMGRETSHPVSYGDVFRMNKLEVPPLVKAGQSVILIYRTKFMEATASGVTLEAGGEGQTIRVKNDSSKRIISGIVLDSGSVQVK